MAQFEVRRPFGRASVFYARTSDGWVSSSRLRSLASRLRSSVNLPVLARWTAVVQEPTDETLFLGIRHLPPCHAFVNGKLSTIAPKPASAPEGSLEELGRLLRRRVESAVEKATLGSRCIGVTVGGLDSCGIAAITSTGESSTVWVNVDLRGEDPDRPYVKALARRHGVRLITRTVDEGEAFLADALLLDGIPCWTAGVVVEGVDHELMVSGRAPRPPGAVIRGSSARQGSTFASRGRTRSRPRRSASPRRSRSATRSPPACFAPRTSSRRANG